MGAPDHFKSILLYGLYNGAATPLACDKQGRLILVMEPVSPYDKSGTILLRDAFSDGLVHSQSGASGSGSEVAVFSDEAASGGHSCRLIAGSTLLREAYLYYRFVPSTVTKHGWQFSVRFVEDVDYILFRWLVYTGEYVYLVRFKYLEAGEKWQLYDYGSDAWVDIVTDVDYSAGIGLFHTVKFVIDVENGCYHRLNYGTGEVDLTDYSLRGTASAYPAQTRCEFHLYSGDGDNATVYLDDVIFTQDES